MTRHEFIEDNGITLDHLPNYNVIPCICGERVCPGWQLTNIEGLPEANVWLDDLGPDDEPFKRDVPEGFVHVRTLDEAKAAFAKYRIKVLSLDHDLGACNDCVLTMKAGLKQNLSEQDQLAVDKMDAATVWLLVSASKQMPQCPHVGTGYDLCLWMAEHGIWPELPPEVHSANNVGATRMAGVIARYYGTRRNGEE